MVTFLFLTILLTVVIFLGDGILRLVARVAFTAVGLGMMLPETYIIKSREIAINGLLLPRLPIQKNVFDAVVFICVLIIAVVIFFQYKNQKGKR